MWVIRQPSWRPCAAEDDGGPGLHVQQGHPVGLDRHREAGDQVSFLAALVKATGMVMDKYPRMNQHLFHGLVGKYQVDFDRLRVDDSVGEGQLFMPFCFAESAVNFLTNPRLDPYGKIPEFKFCAARIEKVS